MAGIRDCISPVPLLEGRRSISGASLTDSSERSGNSASMATLSNDDGWCSSGQRRTPVPSIYLQANFHTDVLISAIVTEGFSELFIFTYYTQQYLIEVAGRGSGFRYVVTPSNSSVAAVSYSTWSWSYWCMERMKIIAHTQLAATILSCLFFRRSHYKHYNIL